MDFAKTLVFSDFHGDLDIAAKSFADKGLMQYAGDDIENLIHAIKIQAGDNDAELLESFIVPQKKPIRLVFLGDCLDRYRYGYHIIRFFSQINWESFNIYPIFLLGNHDLLNLIFMTNPFHACELHQGTGRKVSEVIEFIQEMGISDSLKGFFDLHGDEIFDLQKEFYENSSLEIPFAHYSLTLRYDRDYSFFINIMRSKDKWAYIHQLIDELGLSSEYKKSEQDLYWIEPDAYISKLFSKFFESQTQTNWWSIDADKSLTAKHKGYSSELTVFNACQRVGNNGIIETLPIDWRVISLVWRKYYGDWFGRLQYLFHENKTLFVHGGFSPMSMMDPMVLGVMYDHGQDKFRDQIFKRDEVDLDILIGRCNCTVSHVLTNALNDFSFQRVSGAQILDQMGFWRGMSDGFTTFGGPLWCDFEYIHHQVEQNEWMLNLYKQFCELTEIKRIICGHTHFYTGDQADIKFKMIRPFLDIGLEYICVDNSCSRAYRQKSVLNGIKIDANGNIQDKGEVKEHW